MSKIIKIAIGIILLGISGFYLLGTCLVLAHAERDATYSLRSYIKIEQEDCEYLGRELVLEGNEQTAAEGYGFYQLTFRVENLSSAAYYGDLYSRIEITARDFGNMEVRQVVSPHENNYSGLFTTADPMLPGKTSVTLGPVYVEVKEGTESIWATYYPDWDEHIKELEIVLKTGTKETGTN